MEALERRERFRGYVSEAIFSHEAYVVLEWAKNEDVVGLEEILAACSRLGVGLITLHPYYSSFRCAIQLDAEKRPVSDDYVEEYLEYVFEKKNSAAEQAYKAL